MIYNERVTLIFEEEPEDELLENTETKKSFPVPCMRSSLSSYEMMGSLVSMTLICSNCTYKAHIRASQK